MRRSVTSLHEFEHLHVSETARSETAESYCPTCNARLFFATPPMIRHPPRQ
jgi:hypothetical protein